MGCHICNIYIFMCVYIYISLRFCESTSSTWNGLGLVTSEALALAVEAWCRHTELETPSRPGRREIVEIQRASIILNHRHTTASYLGASLDTCCLHLEFCLYQKSMLFVFCFLLVPRSSAFCTVNLAGNQTTDKHRVLLAPQFFRWPRDLDFTEKR